MFVEVVDLVLAGEGHITCKGYDFHTGRTHKKCHVETYLVVAGTGRTVCNGIGTNLVGIARNGQCLKDSLR